jgi:hypothetical protein
MTGQPIQGLSQPLAIIPTRDIPDTPFAYARSVPNDFPAPISPERGRRRYIFAGGFLF